MRISSTRTPLTGKVPPDSAAGKHGFAWVITLSLMVLLTVLAVGLLSLSAVELRATTQDQAMGVAWETQGSGPQKRSSGKGRPALLSLAACYPERDGVVEPAAAGQAAVSPAEVAEGEVPEAPEAAVDTEVGGFTFLPVTDSARRFALTGVPGPRDLAAIHAVPGLTVLAKPGGKGPVDVSWHDPRAAKPGALAALTAAGVPMAGELLEFELRRPAGMEMNCPSCLFSSYQAARETPGVKDVRTFLGDPENRVVELVVDPDLVTPTRLAEIMRASHSHTP